VAISTVSDAIGRRGEAIFVVLMTEFHSARGPIFRPQFLGDKWPVADYLVELERAGSQIPYFFVQVRTTREGYTKRERRLRVRASQEQLATLAAYPAPTYIVGIDELEEVGYIVSANGERRGWMSSLSTHFPIDRRNRRLLWNEVRAFWLRRRSPRLASAFRDPAWR
jgi:hypothetical protein